jgi:phosphopentomutase
MKRVLLLILDSLGAGDAPDAAAFDSVGSNTLAHVVERAGIKLPNLCALGLANIIPLANNPPLSASLAAYGKLCPASPGKDTTTGHWEIAGLILNKPLPVYPHGFPPQVIEAFSRATGRGVIGNVAASGVAIINELGAEHMISGKYIIYTSADSVFQIAAHEDIIPLAELYEACRLAREILQGEYNVGRVIARPFTGDPGNFVRTEDRRDFSLTPPPGGLVENIYQAGLETISIGKINDIFAGQYFTGAIEAHNNSEALTGLLNAMDSIDSGLIFANFVDFDMLYGHRNDPIGYGRALTEFDRNLPGIMNRLRADDLLCISADHGNDPTTPGTDHSREYVPALIYGANICPGSFGERDTFADLGATIAAYLGVKPLPAGKKIESICNLISAYIRHESDDVL